MKKKNKKNTPITSKPKTKKKSFTLIDAFKYIIIFIKNIFKEIILLLKSIGLGVFSILDFLVSFVISFFTYLFWGTKNILFSLWNYIIKFPFSEIYYMFKSVVYGFIYILSIIFKDLPILIYSKISKYVYDVYLVIKKWYQKYKEKLVSNKSEKPLNSKIKEYVVNKYNNISFVKEAREKREASLQILTINQTGEDAQKSDSKQTYRYLARNKEGKLITGYFAALSRLDVYSYLIDEGLVVYEIETSWAINFFHTEASSLKRKMTNKDLIFWLTQLATYIKAGIPLAEAVKIIAKQDKRRKYKGVYDSVIYELTMGNTFSDSLKKQGNVFPALLVNMIKSSELIGDIEGTLDEMADYYQEIEDTKKAIISAITYPCIVLVFAVAVIIFLLVYIIPQFVAVYESMNAELNSITLFTLRASDYIQNNWRIMILVFIGSIFILIWLYKNIKEFRTIIQRIAMKIPVIGKMIIYKELSIFARTFATLNKNNVLLTDSIDILRKITNNEIYRNIMYHTINNLLKGEKMSVSFKDHWAIPDIAYYMIVTGESTGELSTMLEKVGEYYQKQERNMVAQIKTFIEPVMIGFLAVGVGFILVSVLIPMFGIYNSIS